MTHTTLKVSAIQMVSSEDVESNLAKSIGLMEKAIERSAARLLVLPENVLCFGAKPSGALNDRITVAVERYREFSREQGVVLVAGSVPLAVRPDGSALSDRYRSASLVFSNGRLVARYDKLHMFDVDVADGHGQYRESNTFEAGQDVVVSDLGDFHLGLSICYDLRFPELFQDLRSRGAEVIALPSAFTRVTGEAHWEVLVRARAIETQCFVVAANQGGAHSLKRETWGQSMIVDPWGRILAQCERGEDFCSAELDFESLDNVRSKIPVMSHRRY